MTEKHVTLDTSDCISLNATTSVDEIKQKGPTLSVKFTPDKEYILETKTIKEHEVIAQLDTGANHSCISSSLAEALNCKPIREVLQHAAGQEPRNIPAYKATVTFPTGTALTSEFAVLPSMHNDHDVLIGRDILSICKLVVDFTTGEWSLHFKVK